MDKRERIVQRIRAGEMPPKGAPQPSQAEAHALINFIEAKYAEADKYAEIPAINCRHTARATPIAIF